ncbi:MAG TPA: ABC transporter permease, partial [Nitrospirae bacterium]|nr:ABC transporter permease [Nitrospirota bacterium]
IELRLDDIFLADQVREDIPRILGKGYYGRDWMQMNRNLFSALKLEKFAMFIILILIILVASFNIISTLIMNVIEKEREIAILRAMGATSRGIMTVFVLQGIIIGIIGTILGVAGGVAICYLISNYEIIKLPADVYYLSHLPAKVNPWDVVTVAGAAILISFVSTIYPAYQAARLNPVEPLRYE